MKKIICIALLFSLLVSCKTKQIATSEDRLLENSKEVFSERKETLVPLALRRDSSRIVARFECDSLYNVVLKELNEYKTKNIETALNYRDGAFEYSLKTGGDTVYVKGVETFYKITVNNKEIRNINKTITKTEKVEKKLSWINRFFLSFGKYGFIALILYLTYIIVKNYIKIKLYLANLLQIKK